jgi:hypothetical protein
MGITACPFSALRAACFLVVVSVPFIRPAFVFAQSPASDDFNGSNLNTALWTTSAPAGGTVSVSNGHAYLTVPGGSNHDAFVGGDNAVRILQNVSNSDFDVAAKFDSAPHAQYQGQGILVQQNSGTYMRFEVASNGSQTVVSASYINSGNQHTFFSNGVSGVGEPVWLQVQRAGSTWTLSYSTNGSSYTTAGSFSQNITVSALGPYAWNYNSTPGNSPAITAAVDYFYNLAGSCCTTHPPVISAVGTNNITQTSANVTWTTDIPATSVVNYGTSTNYGSSVSSSTATTSHSLSLTGLTCSTTYDYQVSSTASGQTATSSNNTFTTGTCSGGGSGGPVSDNFDETSLNTSLWTVANPLGDGVVTMNGTAVTLNIPQGNVHDPNPSGNNALRILQNISNADFEVVARFQSPVELAFQDQGLIAQQDSTHFVRFDTFSDGTNVHVYAEFVQPGNGQLFANAVINTPNPPAPFWFKLKRTGNSWVGSWSTDGTNFTTGASFMAALNVTSVGPFAGTNSPSGSNTPAFTATVDYFFNTASPISNQDGPPPFGVITVDPNPGSALVEKTLADIQGTGYLNAVAGYEYPSSGIYWYGPATPGNLSGSWNRYTIVSSGNAYEDMIPLDVNQDGAVDIVASFAADAGNDYSIVWFENPRGHGGNPQTDTWVRHTIGNGYGEDTLIAADLDGDGKTDIANSAYIYFQNSPTSWTQVTYNNAFRGIATFDIGSGKGAINLVSTGGSPYNVVWYENPRETGGNARTGKWIQHTVGASYQCSGCTDPYVSVYNAADFNGDGRMDIVMSQSEAPSNGIPPPGGLIWFEAPSDRRNGNWIRHTIDANYVDAHAIRVADMDHNGTPDLVTSEQDQSPLRRVSIFFNDGRGNFTQQVLSNVEGHNTVVGDVRHTGFFDILNSGHGYYGAEHPLQVFTNPRGH